MYTHHLPEAAAPDGMFKKEAGSAFHFKEMLIFGHISSTGFQFGKSSVNRMKMSSPKQKSQCNELDSWST